MKPKLITAITIVMGLLGLWAVWGYFTDASYAPKKTPPAIQEVADDIELYKTMLWVQSEIDSGSDCRLFKQKLDKANSTDSSYSALLNDYRSCFAHALYYYYHRLPFLKEGLRHGNFEADDIAFREKLSDLSKQYEYVDKAQKLLGYPEPPELPNQ